MKPIIFLLLLSVFISGCSRQKWEGTENFKYTFFDKKCEIIPNEAHLLLDIVGIRTLDDSIFLNTYHLNRKLELSLAKVNPSSKMYSLLNQFCKGDSIVLKCIADTFYTAFGGNLPYYISPGSTLEFYIQVKDRLNRDNYLLYKYSFEENVIQSYLKNIQWNATLDSTSGIYYEKIKKSDAPFQAIKKGKLHYSIQTLNGQPIDFSKENDPFIFDLDNKALLPGLRTMLGKMTVNERVKAILPSHQAYGPEGSWKVGGFSPVILEIEITEAIEIK